MKINKLINSLGFRALMAVVLTFSLVSPAFAQAFTRQLQVGMSGADVSSLQSYLAQDSTIYPQGLVTGYFGTLTEAAVSRFQTKYGIESVGRVGPITLAKLNSLVGDTGDVVAPVISNVSAQPSSTQVVLNWSTDTNAQGKVIYNTSPLLMQEAQMNFAPPIMQNGQASQPETVFSTAHNMTITGLSPNTTYYYTVQSTDQAGNVSIIWPTTFKTSQ